MTEFCSETNKTNKTNEINIFLRPTLFSSDNLTFNIKCYSKDEIGKIFNDFIKIKCNDLLSYFDAFFIHTEEGNKYIGYELLLSKKFNDYNIINNNELITIYMSSPLDYTRRTKAVIYPLLYYNKKQIWPPCINWYEDEIINLGPILTWLGWGEGKTLDDVKDKHLINYYKNLIILIYGNGIKRVYNKWAYLKVLKLNKRDPFTNKKLSNNSVNELTHLITNFQQKNYKLLIEYELEFE